MYSILRLHKFNFVKLKKAADILYDCGKDMAKKYDLHHWDNSHIKTLIIIALSSLKNDIYLVYKEKEIVATFQTRKIENSFLFQKLAVNPNFSGGGIGSYCLMEIEHLAEKNDCADVICEVFDKSIRSRKFYEHRGYAVYGKTRTAKYNLLRLRKKLSGEV